MLITKMWVLCATAFAVLSPMAWGQDAEITNESTGAHCSAVTLNGHTVSGGCAVHAVSTGGVVLRQHVFGVESTIATCNEEFTIRVNEDGSSYFTNQVLSGAGCTRVPCEEEGPGVNEKIPWPTTFRYKNGTGTIHVVSCWAPVTNHTAGTYCETERAIAPPDGTYVHRRKIGQVAEMPGTGVPGFRCEMVGEWLPETGEIEIVEL
jgi:hypothetical protein